MATTTGRGKNAAPKARIRRVSPLLITIPLLALAVAAIAALNLRDANAGPRPLSTLSTQDFHALAWSSTDPNTIFFGHHDGMLVSRDGGISWQQGALTSVDAMSLAIAPSDAKRMYAAGHGALYRSDDGGSSWQSVAGPLQTADIHGFAISPDDANRLYAFIAGEGLQTSGDGGATWRPLQTAPANMAALAAGPGQLLFAGATQGVVYTSADGGATWQQESLGMMGDITSMVYNPASQSVLATALMVGGNQGMLHRRAISGGGWSMTALDGMGVPLALATSPVDAKNMLLVNNRGDVYRSADGGATWGSK